jgi:hypothetical protein
MQLLHCKIILVIETSTFKVKFLPPDKYAAPVKCYEVADPQAGPHIPFLTLNKRKSLLLSLCFYNWVYIFFKYVYVILTVMIIY